MVNRTDQRRQGEMLAHLIARLASTSREVRFAVSMILLILIAALNLVTGPEISFSIFYLVPVAFAGAFLSHRAGVVMAVASAVIWVSLELTSGPAYSADWIPYWNSAVRLGFFLIVNELIDRLRNAHMRVRDLSRTDGLTGLVNAVVFKEYVDRAIATSRRSTRPFTLVYVDLDRFKNVNDSYGHKEGDQALQAVAALIKRSSRAADVVARLGGDEFGILMQETDAEQARQVLERISTAIDEEAGSRWDIGATLGAVTFVEAPESSDHAIHHADTLMYSGKKEGRGRTLQTTWPETVMTED